MIRINLEIDGGKEKDATCEEHYCRGEVGVMLRLWRNGRRMERRKSRASCQQKKARERLIELAKSQEG